MKRMANDYEIQIELEAGAYHFLPYSATGKTYLARMLYGLNERDILVITYDTIKTVGESWAIEKIQKGSYSLIFLDRFDLYGSNEMITAVEQAAKKAIVLLDSKMVNELSKSLCTRLAGISFDNSQISVYPVR